MTDSAIATVQELASRLPSDALYRLAKAAAEGPQGLRRVLASVDSDSERRACKRLLHKLAAGAPSDYLAGALDLAAANRAFDQPRPQVVWTGPGDDPDGRLTLAVVQDLIAAANQQLLLCTFATHGSADIAEPLAAAADRGVELTLLLERGADNPHYDGPADPFPGLPATRLAWPSGQRPLGASLHAKLLVVDRRIALVGSANITGRAFMENLECSVLHRDPVLAGSIVGHIEALLSDGMLVRA